MRVLIFIILLIAVSLRGVAQDEKSKEIDSLKLFFKADVSDSLKILALRKLNNLVYLSDPKQSFEIQFIIDSICDRNLNSPEINEQKMFFIEMKGKALNNIGSTFAEQNNYNESYKYLNRSIELIKILENKELLAISYSNFSMIYRNNNEYELALKYVLLSYDILIEINNSKNLPIVLSRMGDIYLSQGLYGKSLECFEQCYKIANEYDNKVYKAIAFNNIGVIHYKQGGYQYSFEVFKKGVELLEELNFKRGIADIYNAIGVSYKDYVSDSLDRINILPKIEHYRNAIYYFEKSIELNNILDNKYGKAISTQNLGGVYYNLWFLGLKNKADENWLSEMLSKTIEYYLISLNIKKEINNQRAISFSQESIGNVYFIQKNYEEALNYAKLAVENAEDIGAFEESISSLRLLYKIYIKTKSINVEKSIHSLVNYLNIGIKNNYFNLSESEKQNYFATLESDFGLYHDFALHYNDKFDNLTDTSYNIALQNKGLTLKSSTAMRSAIQNSGDTSLVNQYESWLSLKKKIAKLNEIDSTYKFLTDQANDIERELVKSSTIFSDFDKVRNLKWQDVQAGLKPNEAAIEFVHFKSEIDTANPIIYAALIIKKESKHPEMIRLCTEADLKEILGVFQGNNLSFVKGVYGTKSKAEKALYEKIWQPLEKHLKGVQNIYYSPSGLLHKVSFAAISKGDNVFLCDNYQLHQQSSTGKVALPSIVMYDTKDAFLLVGGVQYDTKNSSKKVWDYLPGTKTETENIQSFLQKKKHMVNFYAANDASEDNFKSQANKANVLHISTHGFFYPDPEQVREEVKKEEIQEENIVFRGVNELDSAERSSSRYANWSFVNNKNPLMRSGLVLAGANDVWQRNALEEGEDGILTAQEVSNIDLRNTKLVVLSACETGLGDIKGSEGVFGLQRAFKMAGAQYLIMSLWQVPDKETSEFMQLFYKNLTKVKDIPKAFNLTQQTMRKKYDPYYWAAFVLIN